jgi:hypothetical protein
MSQTMPVQAQVGVIDPETGHMTTEDDVARYRANLPDQQDPPSGRYQVRRFLAGEDPHREPPNDMNSGGGFLGGSFPGWGPPGGGPPGGGLPGGGLPGGGQPLPPAPLAGPGTDKLVGNPPTIFAGD